jgi:long-chain acyl-CoA synthetase
VENWTWVEAWLSSAFSFPKMILERWQQVLARRGDDVALVEAGLSYRFAELDVLARACAAESDGVYVGKGGALAVLLHVLAAAQREKVVQVVERDRPRRMPSGPMPQETFLIKQTVGASGLRRCQFFSEAQILADVDGLHAVMQLVECDWTVAALSPAHSYGLTVTLLQTLLHGLPMCFVAEPFHHAVAAALEGRKRVFLPGIPALWKTWLAAGMDLREVHLAVSAGSPLTLDLEQRMLEQTGKKLHNLYGCSEAGSIAYDDDAEPRASADRVGRLLPGVTAQVLAGGMLAVHGPAVGLGYDELLEGERFTQGDFLTADQAQLCGDTLHWQGCGGKGINVAGRKLAPEEIALKLRTSLGIEGVQVKGEPSRDPERCQQVVAYLDVPEAELTAELKQRACALLAPWELPRRWHSLRSSRG